MVQQQFQVSFQATVGWCRLFLTRVAHLTFLVVSLAAIPIQGQDGTADSSREVGQSQGDRQPMTRAILIGVDGYEKVRRLQFCGADVEALEKSLTARAKDRWLASSDRVLTITDKSRISPTRERILTYLELYLKDPKPQDTVIVFFSGHGFRDSKGRIFLAPLDCDPKNIERTCIPLARIRELIARSSASTKLLIIDACHSGGEKGEGFGLTGKDVEVEMEQAVGVYTIASCGENEQSIEWPEKKHGLFAYWLNRGLAGAADTDGDEVITADELYRFVYDHVPLTAKLENHRQVPVRIVGPRVQGVPVVLRLTPESWKTTLDRLAELLNEQLLYHRRGKAGLAEFTSLVGNHEVLGAQTGVFSRLATDHIEQELVRLSQGQYALTDQRQVTSALRAVAVKDLVSPNALTALSDRLNVLVTGSFLRLANPDRLRLQCKLLSVPEGNVLGQVTGVIRIDEELWSHLGGSADIRSRPIELRVPNAFPDLHPTFTVVNYLNEQAAKPHPLLDPDFPFRVEICSNGKPKEYSRLGGHPNELYVAARPEEEFTIRVKNRSQQRVLLRLLVDGINTIVQQEDDKEVRRVPINEARPWVLEPDGNYEIKGWCLSTGKNGLMRRFKFVEPSQSIAGRLGYNEDIGIITAAFYNSDQKVTVWKGVHETRTQNIAVGGGTVERVYIITKFIPETHIGWGLAATVNIRYVHENMLKTSQ